MVSEKKRQIKPLMHVFNVKNQIIMLVAKCQTVSSVEYHRLVFSKKNFVSVAQGQNIERLNIVAIKMCNSKYHTSSSSLLYETQTKMWYWQQIITPSHIS